MILPVPVVTVLFMLGSFQSNGDADLSRRQAVWPVVLITRVDRLESETCPGEVAGEREGVMRCRGKRVEL